MFGGGEGGIVGNGNNKQSQELSPLFPPRCRSKTTI